MTIAPNGVSTADYDPNGIGAIVFAAVYRAESQTNVNFGDVVDAAAVKLRPCCIIDNTSDPDDGVTLLSASQAVLPGSWKCLGVMYLSPNSVSEAASLFMRVA